MFSSKVSTQILTLFFTVAYVLRSFICAKFFNIFIDRLSQVIIFPRNLNPKYEFFGNSKGSFNASDDLFFDSFIFFSPGGKFV